MITQDSLLVYGATGRYGFCSRCGHLWKKKSRLHPPSMCPECHSFDWDKPRGQLRARARLMASRKLRAKLGDPNSMDLIHGHRQQPRRGGFRLSDPTYLAVMHRVEAERKKD